MAAGSQFSTFSRQRMQNKRTRRKSYPIVEWTGLHDDSNIAAIGDTDLRKATNICLYRANLIGIRFGTQRDPFAATLKDQAAAAAPVNAIFDFLTTKEPTTRQKVLFVADDEMWEEATADPATATARGSAGSAVMTSGATPADNNWTGAYFKNNLYCANPVAVPSYIANTAAATLDVIPNWYADARTPSIVHSQWGYLFFAGYPDGGKDGGTNTNTINPMTVNHGELQDDSTWLENNVIDKIGGLSSFGDEFVTALFKHRDYLMIATNKRIYPIEYTGDIFQRFIVARPLDVGVAGPHAVASINGEYTFFMDPLGRVHTIRDVASGFGDIGIRSINRKIAKYTGDLARERIKYTQMIYWADRGWVCVSVSKGVNQGSHNEMLVLDINDFPLDEPDWRQAKWFRFKNISANVLAVLRRADSLEQTRSSGTPTSSTAPAPEGQEYLYFGNEAGWVKMFSEDISFDEYDDSDLTVQTPIQMEMATKYWDFGVPDAQKQISEILWNMEPASGDAGPLVSVFYDFEARQSNTAIVDMDANLGTTPLWDTAVWGTALWTTESKITSSRDKFNEAGTYASVAIQHSVTGSMKWKMQRMTPIVEIRGLSTEEA